MKPTTWKDIAELIGIAAIVASLLFVGLQMQQQQEIAMASQYQERYSTIMDFWIARQQSDIERPKLGQRIIDRSGLPTGVDPNTTADQFGSHYLWARMTLGVYDNLHFQYESGFLTDDAWSAYEAQIAQSRDDPYIQYVLTNNRNVYRSSFIELMDRLTQNAD